MHSIDDLKRLNAQIIPLKTLADRELISIYGLTGMLYTPHIDDYMTACIKRAGIACYLKNNGLMPLSQVEVISTALDSLHSRARSKAIVEYKGNNYQRNFTPLKLSKSGKIVRKWAKFWLLQSADGHAEPNWQNQVKEIWPQYFVTRMDNI